jgi:DNA-binding winged helix-turn-helix (wHTH) protein
MGERLQRIYEFDEFRLDATDRLLFRGNELVPLSPKVLDTLVMLVENSGRVLHKDELMERVWEGTFVEENNLSQAISALRKALGGRSGDHAFIETVPKRGYRFVARVSEAGAAVARPPVAFANAGDGDRLARLEPVGGAVPLDSGFYIVRPADDEFQAAIARGDSIVLVKGARQMGKTSLLARGLQNARRAGARVVLTDFQDLGAADLESAETLFMTLGKAIAEELGLDATPRSTWDAEDSANTNFARYMRREVLKGPARVVWGLDEVDRLFGFDFANEVFGLFRAWHNKRALDPTGPWQRLTLAMAYATEAHLFITDANQSPFNVGTRLALEDFTLEQVAELNHRYGSPLGPAQLDRFYRLVGGQPYLVQQGLRAIAHGMSFEAFHAHAHREEGPFGDHLRRVLALLAKDPALGDAMRVVLDGRPCPGEEIFHRLQSAGIIAGESAREARPRCPLYALYLVQHLL